MAELTYDNPSHERCCVHAVSTY